MNFVKNQNQNQNQNQYQYQYQNEKEKGVLRLPPGFRFHPTDQELLLQYLTRKVMASPLPTSVIPDFDVCKSDPWDLPPPGEWEQERYFFSRREAKYPNGNRSNRATFSGYWKATGKDKPILVAPTRSIVLGMKKTLVFYRGKPPHGSRTDWIMHEYRLLHAPTSPPKDNTILHQKTGEAAGGWVLCRIFLKKRNNATTKEEQVACQEDECRLGNSSKTPVFYDFMSRDKGGGPADLNLPAPCSSSSGSSAVTEISTHNDNHNNFLSSEESEESSSCCNSSSPLATKP